MSNEIENSRSLCDYLKDKPDLASAASNEKFQAELSSYLDDYRKSRCSQPLNEAETSRVQQLVQDTNVFIKNRNTYTGGGYLDPPDPLEDAVASTPPDRLDAILFESNKLLPKKTELRHAHNNGRDTVELLYQNAHDNMALKIADVQQPGPLTPGEQDVADQLGFSSKMLQRAYDSPNPKDYSDAYVPYIDDVRGQLSKVSGSRLDAVLQEANRHLGSSSITLRHGVDYYSARDYFRVELPAHGEIHSVGFLI